VCSEEGIANAFFCKHHHQVPTASLEGVQQTFGEKSSSFARTCFKNCPFLDFGFFFLAFV